MREQDIGSRLLPRYGDWEQGPDGKFRKLTGDVVMERRNRDGITKKESMTGLEDGSTEVVCMKESE